MNSVAVNNLPGTGPAKDAVVASGVTKDISRKLKSSGGHVLKSWLERKGVLMDATITKKQRAEMKTVFELFDVDGNGVISSGKIAEAFELLNAKPSVPMSEIQSMKRVMVDFEEFERRMIKLGYGERDVLAELYFTAKNESAEKKNREKFPPDLLLLRERRDRTMKSIFKDHIQRQKQIYGHNNADILQLSEILQVAEPKDTEHLAATGGTEPLSRARRRSTHRLLEKAAPVSVQDNEKILSGFSLMVIQARGFPPNTRLRTDSWVQIKFGKESSRTKIQKGTTNPSWNATFRFSVSGEASVTDDHISLSLCVGESPQNEKEVDVLGVGIISIAQVASRFSGWLSMRSDKTRELLHAHHRPEVYVACNPVWVSKYWQTHAGERVEDEDELLLAQAENQEERIDVVEANHVRQMQRLQAWEQGSERPSTSVSDAFNKRSLLFVPPHCPLFTLCPRMLPTSLAASDVMAKLATPFAKDFRADALDPKSHKDNQRWKNLNAPIRVIAGMRAGMLGKKVRSNIVRISVGGSHCLGLDKDGGLFIWGDLNSQMLIAAGAGQHAKTAGAKAEPAEKSSAGAEGSPDRNSKEAVSKAANQLVRKVLGGTGEVRTELGSHPSLVTGLDDVTVFDVACGTSHSVVLSKDGQVYTWGTGDFGKLGHGGLWEERVPRLVGTISKRRTIQIACGSNHTMALTDNGALWSWGDGRFGQLGHGLARDCGVPTRVRALEEVDVVVAVACGSDHTVAVLSNGQLYSWGMGWHGQLGHERVASTKPLGSRRPSSPVRSAARWAPPASQKAHAGQHTTGRVYRQPHETALNEVLERLDVYESTISCDLGHKRSDFDDDQRARCSSSPRLVQGLSGVTIRKIACGSRHTLAYQTEKDGTHAIWSWGDGKKGQLGHGVAYSEFMPKRVESTVQKPVFSMACGASWSALLLTEENAVVWGHLDYGADSLEYSPQQ